MRLITPLGTITIELDGAPVPFSVARLKPDARHCPDVSGRYKLEADVVSDGKEHSLTCRLLPSQPVEGYREPGERLECLSYYTADEKTKLSVGIEADTWYDYQNGVLTRQGDTYDYDGLIEEVNGILCLSFVILPFTKTTHYVFGVSWIDNCTEARDAQTWFAADPTLMSDAEPEC